MAAVTRPRAVLYSRLSRATLESTSLIGQDEDLESLAEREGWDVVARFVDEGLSGGKRRANADECLRMLRDGEATILAAYSVDRFSRQGIGEDAEVIRIVRSSRRTPRPRVVFMREGIDSAADPTGWASRYANWSEMAHSELEVMRARRRRAVATQRAQGRHVIGLAPWGYRAVSSGVGKTLAIDPTEAADVLRAADLLISGKSVNAVARLLSVDGVPTPRSAYRQALTRGEDPGDAPRGLWTASALTRAIQSPSLRGRVATVERDAETGRIVSRDVLKNADGSPFEPFPAIVDSELAARLAARFPKSSRGRQSLRRAARLASGLIFCDCGRPTYVYHSAGGSRVAYRCQAPASATDCAIRSIEAHRAEADIEADFLAMVGHLPAVEYTAVLGTPGVADAINALGERIAALGARITAPNADVAALAVDLAAAQAERSRLLALPAERQIIARDLGGTWGDLWARTDDTAERRGYLLAAYDHFELRGPEAPRRLVPFIKPTPEESPDYWGLPVAPRRRERKP